jgi:hypothetical protein
MVRKITLPLLLIMLFSAFSTQFLMGQAVQIDAKMLKERSNNVITSDRFFIGDDKVVSSGEMPATEAVTSFNIDYDSLSLNDAGFRWYVNKNFTSSGTMTYALVTFDSLIDPTFTPYNYGDHTVLVDTITLLLSHRNTSGQPDTLTISILELDVNNYFTNNVLWESNLVTSTSLTSATNLFGSFFVAPGFAMCEGRFAVRVDFSGPVTDTLGVIASFRDAGCSAMMCVSSIPGAANLTPFYPNSYYGYNNGPMFLEIPTPAGLDLFRDCDGNMMRTPMACENWFVQNFLFDVDVMITDQPLTPLAATTGSTDDDGSNNGTAWVDVTGGLGNYDIRWATTPTQEGDTAYNLPAGSYTAIVTYGNGCERIFPAVTVGTTAGLEEELAAGIDRLDIFPNPSSGTFTLELDLASVQDIAVEVYNLHGQSVFTSTDRSVRDYRKSINLGNAPAGIYLVAVRTTTGTAYDRVVIE